ncbi:SURF1-like protein [Sinomonas cellulolyticus]|uniref:SURF1-like protein n=1 Tax=Sinomonas cellulolyticus TaxID=2801916 RepID=A0ABS1JZV1_9MICC|nr:MULTISPECIES: SURF1 family protein [Sinomonas]MBL0704743.1 SURF1 family protein [Sinomonas cellulolyticus]GHG46808.1 SURF1-like protein [Sinomonas sp. KCTC 49339]
MLRTALKPQWIAALVAALVVSWVFVLLSQWQFSRSVSEATPPARATEQVKPLTDVLRPGEAFPGPAADQMVTLTGTFDAARQTLVADRLQDGRSGWWVVTAFTVDGAPAVGGEHGTVVPVARGWISSPEKASPPPSGPVALTGRLLPSEAPQAKQDIAAGQVATLSVAQLINIWDRPSYPGFVAVTAVATPGGAAIAAPAGLEPLSIAPQPVEQPVNWLNIFYAVEWVVFAGFAIFLWWRLVRDDYERTQDAIADAEAEAAGTAPPHDGSDQTTTMGAHAPSETGGTP